MLFKTISSVAVDLSVREIGIGRTAKRDDVGIVPYAGEVERRGRSASPNIKYVYADIHITLVRVANRCEQ